MNRMNKIKNELLGCLMLDAPETVRRVLSLIDHEMFNDPFQRMLFESIREIYETITEPDSVDLINALQRRTTLNIKQVYELHELQADTPISSTSLFNAKLLNENYINNKKDSIRIDLLKCCTDKAVTSEKLKDVARSLDELEAGSSHSKNSIETTTDNAVDDIENAFNKQIKTGIPTGIYDLDKSLCGGIPPSYLIILAARPGMGKTSLGLNILAHIGIKNQIPLIFMTFEMSGKQIVKNMISLLSNVSNSEIATGNIDEHQYNQLLSKANLIKKSKIHICDNVSADVQKVCMEIRNHHQKYNIKIAFIDYLQLLNSTNRNENRQTEVSFISRTLKLLSLELDIPIVVLSQLNRQCEQRTSKKPALSDLRDSGSIEQDADIVFLLHRDEYYNPDKNKGEAQLLIAKNRNGACCIIRLGFDGRCFKFTNL